MQLTSGTLLKRILITYDNYIAPTSTSCHDHKSLACVFDNTVENVKVFDLPDLRKESYTLCSKKSDAKIEITVTTSNLIRIKHPLSNFNYRFSGTNVANFNKIHRTVSEQQLLKNGTQQQKFPIWKNVALAVRTH